MDELDKINKYNELKAELEELHKFHEQDVELQELHKFTSWKLIIWVISWICLVSRKSQWISWMKRIS